MTVQKVHKCPECENLLEIKEHPKPNTLFGLCLNKQCNKAWFITRNTKDKTITFQLAKKYEEDPLGRKLQIQFGLDPLIIIFRKSEEPPHVYYDVHINKFIIFYRTENDLIHELGHLIIDSNPNHYRVEKPWKKEKRHPIDDIINAIVDIIVNQTLLVNYNMEKFYEETALESIIVDRILNDIKENKKIDSRFGLADYCYIYLNLNYFLKAEDKLKVNKKWKNSLKKLRARILYGLSLSVEKFKNIENQLNEIKSIKDLKDLKQVCNYILNILLEMNIWNEKVVLNKLNERFL